MLAGSGACGPTTGQDGGFASAAGCAVLIGIPLRGAGRLSALFWHSSETPASRFAIAADRWDVMSPRNEEAPARLRFCQMHR